MILAKLSAETARANLAEQKSLEIAVNRDEYKAIADKERERADQLLVANAARQEESGELRASVGFLRQSVDEYKTELKDTRTDLERARSKHKWYGIGGTAAGLGICYLTRR